jgi:selenocysteine lyase/cysteine desulfurase
MKSYLSKRQFLKNLTGVAVLSQTNLSDLIQLHEHLPAEKLAEDEQFWTKIREAYEVPKDFIHLENGYYSMTAKPVMQKYLAHIQAVNKVSSYYMRTRQFDDKMISRKKLAELLGCSHEELIITRNTTESLDTIIAGFDWKTGDEALMAEHDYGAMLDMFKLQAKRHGLTNKVISVPLHPKSDEEIVEVYEKAITPKTRLLMVCHLINITGQILPIKKITEMAHRHGVEVMVDGAHAFAHLNFKIDDLGGVDYYGSSLHKWLGNPLGAGILYVSKDKIKPVWQMIGDMGYKDEDIRKLNHTGTHPVATDLAIVDAIEFHNMIGITRKEARLRYLQEYWTLKVRDIPNIMVNTPKESHRACGIANVGIKGMNPADLAKKLMEEYKIFTVAIGYAGVFGVRVTPHLYITTKDLDAFVEALKQLAKM